MDPEIPSLLPTPICLAWSTIMAALTARLLTLVPPLVRYRSAFGACAMSDRCRCRRCSSVTYSRYAPSSRLGSDIDLTSHRRQKRCGPVLAAIILSSLVGCKARAPLAEVEAVYSAQDVDAILVPEMQLAEGGIPLQIPLNAAGANADLRNFDTPSRDQGRRQTSAAFAVAAVLENLLRQQNQTIDLSEEQIAQQAGSPSVRASADAATRNAIVQESDWPYTAPGTRLDRGVLRAAGVQPLDFNGLVRTLSVDRRPVILAVAANGSWAAPQNGSIPIQNQSGGGAQAVEVSALTFDQRVAGGGYLTFKNSWGTAWGDNGFGYLPFAYCQTQRCYAWAITGVTTPGGVANNGSLLDCNADFSRIMQGGSGVCVNSSSGTSFCYAYGSGNVAYDSGNIACPSATIVNGQASGGGGVPNSQWQQQSTGGRAGRGSSTVPNGTVIFNTPAIQGNTVTPTGALTACGCLQDINSQCFLTRGNQRIAVGAPAPTCAQVCLNRAAQYGCQY